MDRLIYFAAAALCLAACTKSEEYTPGPEDLVVEVADFGNSTKTVLTDVTGTAFASGDKILVYDSNGYNAVFKYRTKTYEGMVFQKVTEQAGFDKTLFASAFYPADLVDEDASTKDKFTAEFNDSTTFVSGSFPKGAAPMVCFGKTGGKIVFSNCFAILRVPVKYASKPAKALAVESVVVESTSTELNGIFEFTSGAVTYKSGGSRTMTLAGCDAAGALDTAKTFFYIALPGISGSSDAMTVTVNPTTDVPFSGTFTAYGSGSASVLSQNYILTLNPFVLNPISAGAESSYSLSDWVNVGDIKVGQITLSKTTVSVAKNASFDVQINGVTDWTKITTKVVSGGSCFSSDKKKSGDNYYIAIKGTEAGTGRLFVNDQVSNSGSYIDITVTEQ